MHFWTSLSDFRIEDFIATLFRITLKKLIKFQAINKYWMNGIIQKYMKLFTLKRKKRLVEYFSLLLHSKI